MAMLSPALQNVSGAEAIAAPVTVSRPAAVFSTLDQPSAAAMETVTGRGLKWLDLVLLTISLARPGHAAGVPAPVRPRPRDVSGAPALHQEPDCLDGLLGNVVGPSEHGWCV